MTSWPFHHLNYANIRVGCLPNGGQRESQARPFDNGWGTSSTYIQWQKWLPGYVEFFFFAVERIAEAVFQLGQSFSTSTKGKELPEGSYVRIEDARSPDPHRALYTDGIGIIAPRFAKELSEQMHLDVIASAFQIRCGGYKGNLDLV